MTHEFAVLPRGWSRPLAGLWIRDVWLAGPTAGERLRRLCTALLAEPATGGFDVDRTEEGWSVRVHAHSAGACQVLQPLVEASRRRLPRGGP